VIDLAGMERHAANIGKCPVCNLSAATYLDPGIGLKLCKACHSREAQRQSHQTGVVV